MTTHINTNLKKCSCQGLNSNCYICYGKGGRLKYIFKENNIIWLENYLMKTKTN